MTTVLRATLALVLLVGFYVLAALVVCGALAFGVLIIIKGTVNAMSLGVGAAIAAFMVLRALYLVNRRDDGPEPGVAVTPEQEPALWQTVTELAQHTQTRPPDEIRLVEDANAAVSEDTRLLGLRVTKRSMYIGLPLLLTFTVAELRAVLGHELGHYSGAHTRLGAPVYRGRAALVTTIQQLAGHPVVRIVFVWYFKLFLLVSQSVSRRQELEADELAVAVSGRAPMGNALRKVRWVGGAWEMLTEGYAVLIGPARARPHSLYAGFHALLDDPTRQQQLNQVLAQERPGSPYDSHPTLSERLAAIARLPEPATTPDERPAAQVLLRDTAVATQAVEASLWEGPARDFPVVPWEDVVARGMYTAANAAAAADLAQLGQRLVGAREPYLDAALEALLRGHGGAMHQQLISMGWDPDPGVLAKVLARALEAALIEQGLARWTLSWSTGARLLDSAGQELDLDQLGAALVADPMRQVPAVRDWLSRSGVPADHRPQALATAPEASQ